MKKTFTQRQIPTLLGLVILVAALIGGIFFIGQGGGVFAPRATAQTTPKKITISNVKEDSFTVSFITDDSTSGFIKYGTTAQNMKTQASDDRDQFSGNVGQFNTHHITVHELQPDTTYYYTLGTAAASAYDNSGSPFSVKTTPKTGTLPVAKTIYGTVNLPAGSPASGALVYVTLDGAYQLSTLTKESGSWAIPLANARSTSTGDYRAIDPTDQLQITAQGNDSTSISNVTVSVANAQPVATITLGQDQTDQGTAPVTTQANSSTSLTPALDTPIVDSTTSTTSPLTDLTATPTRTASDSTDTSAALPVTTVVVNSVADQTVQTAQPLITGTAAPNVLVSVEIHSTAAIDTQVQTDSQGNYTVDLQQLEQQLEPGIHTITITYADPANPSKTITQTKTFTVASQGLIAAITPSPTPFSTNNPFVIASPTPSPSPIPTLEPELDASTAALISKASTASSLPRSGSTATTLFLIGGGVFFLIAGGWSYWVTARHSQYEDLG